MCIIVISSEKNVAKLIIHYILYAFIFYGSQLVPSQRTHHGHTTLKQRRIDVIYVETTLFKRRLTMNCPLGC